MKQSKVMSEYENIECLLHIIMAFHFNVMNELLGQHPTYCCVVKVLFIGL